MHKIGLADYAIYTPYRSSFFWILNIIVFSIVTGILDISRAAGIVSSWLYDLAKSDHSCITISNCGVEYFAFLSISLIRSLRRISVPFSLSCRYIVFRLTLAAAWGSIVFSSSSFV